MFKLASIFFAVLIAVFLRVTRAKAEFVIDFEDQRLEVRHGKVPGGFLKEGRALLTEVTAAKGTITGVKRDGRIALEFSADVPRVLHQRFRNVWNLTSNPS